MNHGYVQDALFNNPFSAAKGRMSPYLQTPNSLPWPPMIFVSAFFGAAILQKIVPVGPTDRLLQWLPSLFGLLVCLAGAALAALAVRELWRSDTTVLPTSGASALVTTGVYKYTRNPIYIGELMVLVGVAVAFRWTWLLLILPATVFALQAKGVMAEERHLAVRFSKEWHDYARSTPRWL